MPKAPRVMSDSHGLPQGGNGRRVDKGQRLDRNYCEGHFLSSKGAATITAPARRDCASFG
ncbi:hypothetical protein [Rhizobium altiplani]|uniref:hypothetical protein n=1 Tax=Rhizobium altiplani TaxID=1864509 RepID=UPI0013662C2C|nr:hypothetical protein [Rhizobium altiplani]